MLRTMIPSVVMFVLVGVGAGALRAADIDTVSVDVVRDGMPAATIVIAKEPTRAAQLAAKELQYHVQKITGATLPVVDDKAKPKGASILVGESEATRALKLPSGDFQSQEYLIKFLPGTIVLMGRDKPDRGKMDYAQLNSFPGFYDDQATCYAVYDFLERFCGVRWYLPTELGLVCPKSSTLRVSGREIRRAPALKLRREELGVPIPADLCGDTVKGKHSPPALSSREKVLWHHRLRVGGEAFAGNHSFYGYYDRYWKKNPKRPELFVEAHPDWFAQGYSESELKALGGRPPQMCYTNEGFIQQVVQDARDYFDGKGAKPGALAMGDYFALVPMDNYFWCKCAKCRALLHKEGAPNEKYPFPFYHRDSDYVFTFVNKVACEVGKSHPNKFLSAIAYLSYQYPPERERMEPNVAVTICKGPRGNFWPEKLEKDRQVVELWAAQAPSNRKFLVFLVLFSLLGCHDPAVSLFSRFQCAFVGAAVAVAHSPWYSGDYVRAVLHRLFPAERADGPVGDVRDVEAGRRSDFGRQRLDRGVFPSLLWVRGRTDEGILRANREDLRGFQKLAVAEAGHSD